MRNKCLHICNKKGGELVSSLHICFKLEHICNGLLHICNAGNR